MSLWRLGGAHHYKPQKIVFFSLLFELNLTIMSASGSDVEESNSLLTRQSKNDSGRKENLSEEQREENRIANIGQGQELQMASPSVVERFDKSLQEFLKQGPILREIQRGLTDLKSRVGTLERKRKNTEDRMSENKKQKLSSNLSGSELSDISSESEEDNLMDSNTPNVSKASEHLSTAAELDHLLSDGELDSGEESDDDILKDLKSFFKGSEETGSAIDKDMAAIVNSGLRAPSKTEEVKKLKEKFLRPANIENLQVPRTEPVIWRNMSEKSRAADAAIQKSVAKFVPGVTAVIQQLELLNKHKKEVQKNPIFKEIRKLSTEAVSALSHAIYASCQQRKDLIKNDIDEKFHSLCEPSHAVSATNLFGDNLNTKLKELDDTKKVSVSKRKNYMRQDRKRKFDRHDNRYQEDFRRGYSKNHKPYNGKKGAQQNQKKDHKGKWSQKRH